MNRFSVLAVALASTACSVIYAEPFMHIGQEGSMSNDVKVSAVKEVSHEEDAQGNRIIRVHYANGTTKDFPMEQATVTFDGDYIREKADVCVNSTARLFPVRVKPYESEYESSQKYDEDMKSYQEWLDYCKDIKLEVRDEWQGFTDEGNYNSLKVFANIVNNNKKSNSFFSPLSLQYALAMLANGADDELYSDISRFLGKENWDLDDMNGYYDEYMKSTLLSKSVVSIANSAWCANDERIGLNFLENIRTNYSATIRNVNFRQDSTFTIMDKWVDDNTNGLIKGLGFRKEDFTNLKMVLVNTLYLKSPWVHPFSYTDTTSFMNADSVDTDVPMMHLMEEDLGTYEDEKSQAAILPLRGNYNLEILLPKEHYSPEQFILSMDSVNYTYDKRLYLSLPEFKTEAKMDLAGWLQGAGLGKMFDSGHLDAITSDLYVSKVCQNSKIIVNKDGVEAAAATAIYSEVKSAAPEEKEVITINVNHPFLLRIRDKVSHNILFVGIINNM